MSESRNIAGKNYSLHFTSIKIKSDNNLFLTVSCKAQQLKQCLSFSVCIPNSTKSQNLGKHQEQQTITETENLRTEMIALKSFVVDQIYMVKKRSNDKGDELLIKNLLDQIEFLKQELKSEDTVIKMILENYRQTTD